MIAIKKKTIEEEINLDIVPQGLSKPKRVVIQITKENKDILCQKNSEVMSQED